MTIKRMQIDEILSRARVMPVLDVPENADSVGLARALAAGGLSIIEMTMRSRAAPLQLAAIKKAEPGLIVGMGTVLDLEGLKIALGHGADFVVTPGCTDELLQALHSAGVAALPGIATVSEAMRAAQAGFKALKFFPAEPAGGRAYLKSMQGPLPELKFCPTGGIAEADVADYLAVANVACVGGSWIAPKAVIAEGGWTAIAANARRAARFI